MSGNSEPTSSHKRKRPEAEALTGNDEIIYNLIHEKAESGIAKFSLNRTNIPTAAINKILKKLIERNLIKLVQNVKNKGTNMYIASEFKPSDELTGGQWYSDGNLDVEFIKFLKDSCLRVVRKEKVATLESVVNFMKSSGMFKVEVTKKQFEEILKALVLDDALLELKSTGVEEFASIPVGKVCYKAAAAGGKRSSAVESRLGAMASVPCGVCPRIGSCTPDGVISPKTCVYFQKWLDF
ncbi:Probable DNA-directed RNA polymerase III subunit rpc6 [Linum grandiflorum]